MKSLLRDHMNCVSVFEAKKSKDGDESTEAQHSRRCAEELHPT